MKQSQITLDQQSLATLDELENILKIPRAKIIQKALTKLKTQFAHVFTKQPKKRKHTLDNLIGIIDVKSNKKINYSQRVDEIYLRD